jgi:hypothetical protein
MDRWGWEQLDPWLQLRATLPVGALFCVLRGPTRGRPWVPAGARSHLHIAAGRAGVRRRFAPHQLRHAHAVEMSREEVPLLVIPRQLGPCRSRDHLRLLARDRQHRGHPRRPRTARTDDPGDERTEDLSLTEPYWWGVSHTTHRLFASLERASLTRRSRQQPGTPRHSSALSPLRSPAARPPDDERDRPGTAVGHACLGSECTSDETGAGSQLGAAPVTRWERRDSWSRCRCFSPQGAVGVSSNPASTGSSLRGRAGLSERPLTQMRAAGGVGCASGEMRDATDPREEPCIRSRAGTRRRPFVAPVVRQQQRPAVPATSKS